MTDHRRLYRGMVLTQPAGRVRIATVRGVVIGYSDSHDQAEKVVDEYVDLLEGGN